MKFKNLHFTFFILILISFCSCTSYKNVPYFQNLKKDSLLVTETINNYAPLAIQPGDLLGLHVTSLNPEADAAFNYNLQRLNGNNLDLRNANENAVLGFLVDQDGNITLPYVGAVKVAGFTTSQIAADVQSKLTKYLTNPNVNVRIQNFKISVLGDVGRPGTYDVFNERITFTEALALAGDLNVTGVRNNVLLVREVNGKREYYTVNLTQKELFNSPYYYLRNNDVIYVQPNRDKVSSSDSAYQKASLAIAALSILAILLTR
ncbi:polysaccharide export protein [Inquilinus sp. KBS0705]|nr:polysaccharide export protein [Inquilinus sp. KBS0705]